MLSPSYNEHTQTFSKKKTLYNLLLQCSDNQCGSFFILKEVITEVIRREKEEGIMPDHDLDTYMKVSFWKVNYSDSCSLA